MRLLSHQEICRSRCNFLAQYLYSCCQNIRVRCSHQRYLSYFTNLPIDCVCRSENDGLSHKYNISSSISVSWSVSKNAANSGQFDTCTHVHIHTHTYTHTHTHAHTNARTNTGTQGVRGFVSIVSEILWVVCPSRYQQCSPSLSPRWFACIHNTPCITPCIFPTQAHPIKTSRCPCACLFVFCICSMYAASIVDSASCIFLPQYHACHVLRVGRAQEISLSHG